jgi:D-alanine-D-alanine ligase
LVAQEIRVNNFGRVAVLMGGTSAEREISLISGRAVLDALLASGIEAFAFDPAEQPIWTLPHHTPDCAFMILHGRQGEDGTMQAALELMGIPYTGSGVMASALAMDKLRTKLVWSAVGIPTPRWHILKSVADLTVAQKKLGLPLVIKPAHEGSSIGVTVVRNEADLLAAFDVARKLDSLVLAEEFVVGQELTSAVLGERVLPVVRIEAPEGRYDYANKYFTDVVHYHCPAGLTEEKEAEVAASSRQAFDSLGCRGWGRADLIMRADGSLTFLEMNTAPGMTGHSLVPIAARAVGIDFPALVQAILAEVRRG